MFNPISRILALAALVALGSAAHGTGNDVQFGGSRTFGMGGAGIALPLDVYQTHRLNPALLGFAGKKLRVGVPYLGYHTDNVSLGQINDLIGDIDKGGVADDQVVKLARKYGSDIKEFGLNAGTGVSYAGFALSFRAEADVRSVPNKPFRDFLATGDDDYNNAPLNSRLDAYGIGFYETTASYGHEIPLPKKDDRVSLGVSIRAVSAFYAHKIADVSAIANGSGVRNGTELSDENDDVIQRSALGADFGALASFAKIPNAYFGVAVRNAVEPNVTFVRTGPDADFPLRRDLRPFKRQVGIGAAYVQKRYLAALDVVDLGDHAGAQAVRFGAEYAFNKLFAVRAGYDTRSKFTVGVSIGGLNAALNANGTTSIVQQIRF